VIVHPRVLLNAARRESLGKSGAYARALESQDNALQIMVRLIVDTNLGFASFSAKFHIAKFLVGTGREIPNRFDVPCSREE
jgi:hypothetical protein